MSINPRSTLLTFTSILLLTNSVKADWGWGNGGPWRNNTGDWDGCPPWWHDNGDCDGNNNGNGGSGNNANSADPSRYGLSASQVDTSNRIITIHAILASVAWVFLIPTGAILLRLGIRSPWIIRIHAFLQSVSYLIFIAAAGLGILLVQQLSYGPYSLWDDPHTKLGVAILAITFVQPFLGLIHHLMFKRRASALKEGKSDKQPSRTIVGHGHLWIGRILIVLGMINGGLGIRLASTSPFAGNQRTKAIAYAVCAAIMFLIYLIVVITFELKKMRTSREARQAEYERNITMAQTSLPANHLPTYDQSQDSIQKGGLTTARYE